MSKASVCPECSGVLSGVNPRKVPAKAYCTACHIALSKIGSAWARSPVAPIA
jgi:hypothetical protein